MSGSPDKIGIVTNVADVPMLFWGVQGDTDPKGDDGFGVFERRLPLRMIDIGVIRLGAPGGAPQAVAQ